MVHLFGCILPLYHQRLPTSIQSLDCHDSFHLLQILNSLLLQFWRKFQCARVCLTNVSKKVLSKWELRDARCLVEKFANNRTCHASQEFKEFQGVLHPSDLMMERTTTTSFTFGLVRDVTGSCEYRLGNTVCLCTIKAPSPCPSRHEQPTKAYISVNVAPYASPPSHKQASLTKFITDVLYSVIITTAFPRAMIEVFVQTEELEGSHWAVAFNAVMGALVHSGLPLNAIFVAASACILDGDISPNPTQITEAKVIEMNAENKSSSLHTCIFAEDGIVECNKSIGRFRIEDVQRVHDLLRHVAEGIRKELLDACESFIPQNPIPLLQLNQ
jgi:ribonuclease PH